MRRLLLESVWRGDVVLDLIAVLVEIQSSRRDCRELFSGYAGVRALTIAAPAIRSGMRAGRVPVFHTGVSCRRQG